MPKSFTYSIFPLGDSALVVDFGNLIDLAVNDAVIRYFNSFTREPVPGQIEVVPAYSSLAIFYDTPWVKKNMQCDQSAFEKMKQLVKSRLDSEIALTEKDTREISIPVCYENEYAPDMETLVAAKGIPMEEVIRLHTGKLYTVYMLGFLPGFAYMGEVDEQIAMPRKASPQQVRAGGVGIAGKQTGIYPLNSPGGWSIIGTTPEKLFDPFSTGPTLLRAGDRVRFFSINSDEFKNF